VRRTLIAILVGACLATSLVACAKVPYAGGRHQPAGPAATAEDQAHAYVVVLEALYGEDTGLNGGTYLALDLTQVRLTDTAPLEALARSFAEDRGYTLLLDTLDGLESEG